MRRIYEQHSSNRKAAKVFFMILVAAILDLVVMRFHSQDEYKTRNWYILLSFGNDHLLPHNSSLAMTEGIVN